MMRYPCSACGGRGPHVGPGHQYTTDPNFKEAEAEQWDRFISAMKSEFTTALVRAQIDLALKTVPAPKDDYWRERDGTLPGSPEGVIGDTVEMPRADAEAVHRRVGELCDMMKLLDIGETLEVPPKLMHEIRSIMTAVGLMLDTAFQAT